MPEKTPFSPLGSLVNSSILGGCIVIFILFSGKFFSFESIWPDEALYLWCGKLIATHPWQILSKEVLAFHLPLFPLCLAPFAGTNYFLLAGKSIPCVFGIAGILLLFYLGKSIANAFTGLCAAIALAFNYLYFSYSTRALTDIPVTTLFILAATYLYHGLKNPAEKAGFIKYGLFFSILAAIAFKWSGTILLIVLATYYIGRAVIEKDPLPQRSSFWKTIFVLIGILIGFLFINLFTLGSPFPKLAAIEGEIFVKPWWYYLMYVPITIGWGFFLLALYGASKLFQLSTHARWVLLSWFIAPLLVVSFAHEKNLRYALPMLPALFLLCGLGADSLAQALTKHFRHYQAKAFSICLLIFFFGTFTQFTSDRQTIETEIHRYTGYADAGTWILKNAAADTIILASSPRALRFFTGINLSEYGGKIFPLPETKEAFEQQVKNTSSVILELDRWAFHNPRWAYPLTHENLSYFSKHGNISTNLIRAPYATASEEKNQTVIFLIKIRK